MFYKISLTELQRLRTLAYPLLVIAAANAPTGEIALAEACQVDRKTARRWLAALAELGFLQRYKPHNGYALTAHAQACLGTICPALGENLPQSVQSCPDSPSVNDSSLSQLNIEELKESTPPNGENLPSLGDSLPVSADAFQTLRSAGILEPKRSELARLSWMSPAYIASWIEHLSHRKRFSTGLLIHCLESSEPPPAAPTPAPSATPILDRLLSLCASPPDALDPEE